MECPQATMMGNHAEGDLWMVDIQLMYAQHWPEQQQLSSHHEQSIQAQQQLLQQQILLARGGASGGMGMGTGIGTGASMMVGGGSHSTVGVSSGSFKRPEKPLRELLEEQDIGKLVAYLHERTYVCMLIFYIVCTFWNWAFIYTIPVVINVLQQAFHLHVLASPSFGFFNAS